MNGNRIVMATRVVGVAVVVALAVLLGVRVQARAQDRTLESEFREKVGPLEVDAYASAPVPDGENAALWLRAAAAALALDQADKDLVGDCSVVPVATWTEDQRHAIGRLFSRKSPALELAAKATTMPRSSYLLVGQQATSAKPEIPLLDLIWMARLIHEHAQFALARGDAAAYRQGVSELACVAASLEREAPLIAQLIGLASERMMADLILLGVRSPQAERTTIEGLDGLIPDVDLVGAWKRALGCLGAGYAAGSLDFRDVFGLVLPNLVTAVQSRDEAMRILVELSGLSARPLGGDAALAKRLEQSRQIKQGRPIRDFVAGVLVRSQSVASLRRLARLAVAVRLEALVSGRYPDTLAAWPEASAPDPFTGGPLHYERHADGSAVIAVPGAEDLYNRINELKSFTTFTWELPAPPTNKALRPL